MSTETGPGNEMQEISLFDLFLTKIAVGMLADTVFNRKTGELIDQVIEEKDQALSETV